LKVTYTEEAIADIVGAIAYLTERNPTAASKLDRAITRWGLFT
jgi:plasmid stabilization system protein ParE